RSLTRLVGLALTSALITGAAGWLVSSTAGIISARLELSGALMGGILVPGTTSLPELVTTIAWVRRGALVLAVGGIIGGNALDVLFAVASDAAYREGSIYHSIAGTDLMTVVLALVMSAILLFGLLTRERRGPANI